MATPRLALQHSEKAVVKELVRAKMLVIFTFLAGCCAAAWALFGTDLLAKIKEVTKEY